MKRVSSNYLFYGKIEARKMPILWLFGYDKMGQTEWSPAIQMQELREPVYRPKKGRQPQEQICLVPLVGRREADYRADIYCCTD